MIISPGRESNAARIDFFLHEFILYCVVMEVCVYMYFMTLGITYISEYDDQQYSKLWTGQ